MKFRALLLVFASITITACDNSEPEQAAKIFVPGGHTVLMRELSQDNIPYRVDSDDIIWFPASYADQVNKIGARVVAKDSSVISAVIDNPDKLAIAVKRLKASRIDYTISNGEDGTIITWDVNKSYDGSIILYEVMFSEGNASYNKSFKCAHKIRGLDATQKTRSAT